MYIIITIIKITWRIELGKEILLQTKRPKNHDTKQDLELQKETEIKREKIKLRPY